MKFAYQHQSEIQILYPIKKYSLLKALANYGNLIYHSIVMELMNDGDLLQKLQKLKEAKEQIPED